MDIVAHSQGGLVVREMLRAIWQDKDAFPSGSANPANHIGKLVTVDTPHFGSELATVDASDSVLKAESVFPNLDGWQIRLHYSDWIDFKYLDDWSADYNIGIPKVNRKIVVYDKEGKILWGREPENFRSEEEGIVPVAKGTIAWSDASPWELNMFKPKVVVKNTGGISLKDYHAKLWFRVPDEKALNIPADDWYTPLSSPSLKNIAENIWELDLFF